MENDALTNSMLIDFFGDILTEKQRDYLDLYYNEDLSLSEIGNRVGITKQGVYDIIKRAKKTLMNIESKTKIIQKWIDTRRELEQAIANNEYIHPVALRYFQLEED